MKRICILGGGFAGLESVRCLAEGLRGRKRVEVVLIDDRESLSYSPLLYDVATGSISSKTASAAFREVLEGEQFRHIKARAERVDLERSVVVLPEEEVHYDYLVVSVGMETHFRGLEGVRASALPFQRVEDAIRLHRIVFSSVQSLAQGNEVERPRSFVIVGGGLTGVELAAELASQAQAHLLPRLDEELRGAFKVTLVEERDTVLPACSDGLQKRAQKALERCGVEVVLSDSVVGYEGGSVALESGGTIDADHLIWAGGFCVPAWIEASGFPIDASGRIDVAENLEVVGVNNVFAAGDCAGSGEPSMSARRASRQGLVVAENILTDLVGGSHQEYVEVPGGDFVRLGRFQAAFGVGKAVTTGAAAWTALRVLHMASAPTMSKRAAILGEQMEELFQGPDWRRIPLLND